MQGNNFSFVTKGFNRIQRRSFMSWIVAEEDANHSREGERNKNRKITVEKEKEIRKKGAKTRAGHPKIHKTSAAIPPPMRTPISPPIKLKTSDSVRNCKRT